jgi:hypothetical protein
MKLKLDSEEIEPGQLLLIPENKNIFNTKTEALILDPLTPHLSYKVKPRDTLSGK